MSTASLESPVAKPTIQPGARVLVVEDDNALQEAILDTLELAGFSVFTADSAEQALTELAGQQRQVDMVISDVNMSGMDGHELLAAIKQQRPWLPVLLITAYGTIDRSVQAMQAGAVDYLVKPFEPKVLIELVRRHALGQRVSDDEHLLAIIATQREYAALHLLLIEAADEAAGELMSQIREVGID